MDAPKSRPTVTITTYLANNSAYHKQNHQQQQQQQQQQQHSLDSCGRVQEKGEFATKCEFSTNLFRNNLRHLSGVIGEPRSHETLSGGGGGGGSDRPRTVGPRSVLSDLSQIRGPTGSVRGHKDVVRKSLEGIKVTYHNRFTSFPFALSTATSSSSSSGGSSLLSFSTFFASQSSARQQNNGAPSNQQSSLTSFSSNKPRLSANTTNGSLITLDNELFCTEYLERLAEDEQDLCVAYTTTLGVIRRTFEDSKMLKSILDLNLVSYEERDIYLNQEYKHQLKLRSGSIVVPALYVDGVHIGGATELERMNENGELAKLLAKFKMSRAPRGICYCCGNAKFIACQSCNGSRKSTIHHFKFNSIALRCIKCDKNDGLVQCPVCCSAAARPPACGPIAAEQMERTKTPKVEPGGNSSSAHREVEDEDERVNQAVLSSYDPGKSLYEGRSLDLNNNSVEC